MVYQRKAKIMVVISKEIIINKLLIHIQKLIQISFHNDEVVAFIDKVAKLLQRRHPEVSKLITEKFVPVKGKS
jgi:hypothetical protein